MKNKDPRNHKSEIEKTIRSFYQCYYDGDRIKMYSYLTTSFQKEMPLNYFLIHSDYDADFGHLKQIDNIEISQDAKNRISAKAEATAVINKSDKIVMVHLKMDFGGWKIDGNGLYRINKL